MRSIVKIAVLTLLLFTTSCTYDFSGDYFKEIQTNEPDVKIKLNGFSNGEEISSSKIVQYSITGIVYDQFEMVVKVDNVEIHRSQTNLGEFYLYVNELIDGEHILTFEYIFPSNSGSLANALGGEFYSGGASYNFTLDKSLASPFGIESINIIEGSIYINLNPILDDNFEEAFLVIKNEYDYIMDERQISQEDLTNLQIHDDKTLFYNPRYAIKLKNAFKEDISDFVLLPTTKMNFILEYINYNERKMTYNAHPFYGNFDIMRIEYYDFFSGNRNFIINPLGGEQIINHPFDTNRTYYPSLKIFKNDALIEIIDDPAHIFQFN